MPKNKKLQFRFHKSITKNVKIFIGKNSYKLLNELVRPLGVDRFFVICDTTIQPLYGNRIKSILQKVSPVHLITHSPDEKNKNLKAVKKITKKFFNLGGSPESCFCALGGGITGNMTGFIASIIFRGIKFFHVPTTLLAQLDSAPDVKQSINAPTVKNAIGSYKAPDFVLIDPSFLKTLDKREIKSGLAEAVKHAFAQNLTFLKFITSAISKNKLNDLDILEDIAYKTISLKIKHWENTSSMWNDAKKIERLTHLGHTIGKALEMVDIDYLTHGEAISHGMAIEFYISSQMGYLDLNSVSYAKKILEKFGLLFSLNDNFTTKNVLKKLYSVKQKPLFALLKHLGDPNTISTKVPDKIVSKAITWHLKSLKR